MNPQMKSVLLLGGVADGQVHDIDIASMPMIRVEAPSFGRTAVQYPYLVQPLLGTSGIHYIGVQSLDICPIETLIEGYRHPDINRPVIPAGMSVLCIGGPGDGYREYGVPERHHRMATPLSRPPHYSIISIAGKDGKMYRVGVLDPIGCDVLKDLIAGYRK